MLYKKNNNIKTLNNNNSYIIFKNNNSYIIFVNELLFFCNKLLILFHSKKIE